MQEVLSVQHSFKQSKEKKIEKKPKKKTEDKKEEGCNLMNDPLALLYVKPIGQIAEGEFKGNYYYLSHFQDTRLYRHVPDEEVIEDTVKVGYGRFEIVCNGFPEIKEFMTKIKEGELFDNLDENC